MQVRMKGHSEAMTTEGRGIPLIRVLKEGRPRRPSFFANKKGWRTMSEPTEKTRATITVSSKGTQLGEIVLRFFHDVAPGHVKNFTNVGPKRLL